MKHTPTSLAHDATLIIDVNGVLFYEDPRQGDEAPMIAVIDNIVVRSPFWDAEDWDELDDWVIAWRGIDA